MVAEAIGAGYLVTTIGTKKNQVLSKEVTQVLVDRKNKQEYSHVLGEINNGVLWDIVLDVLNFGGEDARETYEIFKNSAKHIFIMSTTLVYDRSQPSNLIKSSHPLAQKGVLGGYVDQKLELEKFWSSITDHNWTILRPYHILGPGSLLGCLPDHNRDPKLLERIKNNEPLYLCNGGNIALNYIHPSDIAHLVLKCAGNPITYGKAYNAVNPTRIIAKDYFEMIGKVLGKTVCIVNKPIQEIWEENKGWQLTTLPHEYDVSDLKQDIDFIPSVPLEIAIHEAIGNYPKEQDIKNISVHERMTLLPRPQPIKWLLDV